VTNEAQRSEASDSTDLLVGNWQRGEPPKDGKQYEMKRIIKNAGGQNTTVDWAEPGWWNGKIYVRRSQFHGGEIALVPRPNRWRNWTTNHYRKRRHDP